MNEECKITKSQQIVSILYSIPLRSLFAFIFKWFNLEKSKRLIYIFTFVLIFLIIG